MKRLLSFFSKPYIYVQLHENEILLGTAQKHGKKTYITNIITHPLTNSEIIHNRIYNPTSLHTLINTFAKTHNMNNPHLIVAAPYLAPTNVLGLLQTALCLSKDAINIDSIHAQAYTLSNTLKQNVITQTINLLDNFMPPAARTTKTWLLATCFLFGIAVSLSFVSYRNTRYRIQSAQNSLQKIDTSLANVKNKIVMLKKLEHENATRSQIVTTLTSFKNTNNPPLAFLTSIASLLPHQSKLSLLEYNYVLNKTPHQPQLPNSKKTTEKTIPIVLKGVSQEPENTNRFVRSLSKKWNNATFSLAYLRKTKRPASSNNETQNKKRPYLFTIKGSLPKNHQF